MRLRGDEGPAGRYPVSLRKSYSKDQESCKVTFELPEAAAPGAVSVHLVGDFNNWNESATEMKKGKDGNWTAAMTLASGRQYYFRYLIDGDTWENDWNADKYVQSPYSDADNSVVIV
jgi:1,4-alpha-glucan branching enzyme